MTEQEQTPFKQREHLDYPSLTMYEMVKRIADQFPTYPAYEFFGKKTSYQSFLRQIDQAARAFRAAGIDAGDAITICMPNTPQALVCFYAINRVSGIANMVHPQSAQNEITFYLNFSHSKMILTVDLFYEKVVKALEQVDHEATILVARMQDELPPHLSLAYTLRKGASLLKYPGRGEISYPDPNQPASEDTHASQEDTDHAADEPQPEAQLLHHKAVLWKLFVKTGLPLIKLPDPLFDPKRTSVILYSGGTSGTPKGICLTDLNFNACAMQAVEAIGVTFKEGLTMLSCMPCFHGFGLGINLHLVLIHGACCILMPTFNSKSYAKMLVKKRPNFIAGVPTIFEALLHLPQLDGADLSHLHGMFCGGDSLSVELKKKIDAFLKEHGATIQVREGYGLTECVTASCLTPRDEYRERSIGIPFPDTEYKIMKPGTDEELPPGKEGEIVLTGPTVMLGYYQNEEETAQALKLLGDGKTWLYTGDLGYMDEDGYVYFRQRIKRMIITNGYNVYPGQIENVIDSCPEVAYSCVIGVKDPRRMHRVRAYVVLRDGVEGDDACKERIMEQLRLHVAAYALPREMIFRTELPKTLVGKVAYRMLEEEAEAEGTSKAG